MKTSFYFVFLMAVFAAVLTFGSEGKFSTFPENRAGLVSPDGRLVVRSIESAADPSAFVGPRQRLILENRATGQSRTLIEYLGHVAVAWANDSQIIVNEYFTNRGARALLLAVDEKSPSVVIDKTRLATIVPEDVAGHLLGNDHVYVEAYGLNGNKLALRVWGNGKTDASGFRFNCEYRLDQGTATCGAGAVK